MTGPEHYAEADQLADTAEYYIADLPPDNERHAYMMIRLAQVHATLALAAATALPAVQRYWGGEGEEDRRWSQVLA